MADRKQEQPGFEPAARVDGNDSTGRTRNRIDDESINFSETLSGGAFDIHVVEVDNLIVELIGLNIPQPWKWMIQRRPPICASVRSWGK